MKRNVCEEKGGNVPEAKVGICIRSKEKGLHTHTHTHTHFQVQGLEKGVSENEAPGPVGAYTTTHNDTITLMPNLIHRISFTELKFECRTRVAEGTSAGRSTLRHNRTHAPTGPRRARTYMRI